MWQLEGGWGEMKQDYRIGQLCSIQANINRDKKKKPQPYKPDDFAMRPKQQKATSEDKQKKIRANLDMLSGVKTKPKKKKQKKE